MDFKGLTERDILRDFLKRLLRLAPFVVFEALDESALDEELVEIAKETVVGVLSTSGRVSVEEATIRAARVFGVQGPPAP